MGSEMCIRDSFYIKHFIKNIIDVKKEVYDRVYLPELDEGSHSYFKRVSTLLESSVTLEESLQIGWKSSMGNSVVFSPRHRDLVLQKPFIVAVLSGVVERAVEGSPVFVRLIQ